MKQYFYSDGLAKHGPYSFEELRGKKISRNTMVWFHPMKDWQPAGEIPELEELFIMEPPEVKSGRSGRVMTDQIYTVHNRPPRTYLVESILVTFFCCMPFGIVGIINAARVESQFNSGDLEGAKRSSEEAGRWTKIGFWLGIAIVMVYLVFMLFGIVFNL